MKKIYTSAFVALTTMFIGNNVNAQLADYSVATDFTLTDINGNTQHLYDYLNQGKTVFIDVSAAWCGPCWNYHNSGILDDLWAAHGPSGATGVNANTTNDVVVLFLEGELTNTIDQINGIGSTPPADYATGTQGNWVTGSNYPIIDLPSSSVLTSYKINYFPTLYKICPNRIVTLLSQSTNADDLYNDAKTCQGVATQAYDPSIVNYTGDNLSCDLGALPIKVRIQNMGTQPLTSAAIEGLFNGQSVAWWNWTGNLATYAVQEVTVGSFYPTSDGQVKAVIRSTNNVTANDESNTVDVSLTAVASATQSITIKISTDAYGSETKWKLKKSNGSVVAQGGPFSNHVDGNNQAIVGTYPQTDRVVSLPAADCYTFEITDDYGDGMCCQFGNGSYEIVDANNNQIFVGGNFLDSDLGKFGFSLTGIEEEQPIVGINVYPNPSVGTFNLDLNLAKKSDVAITVTNAMGQVVHTENKQNIVSGQHIYNIDLSSFADGIYMVSVNAGDKRYTKLVTLAK